MKERKKYRKHKLTERDEAILYMRKIRHLTMQELGDMFGISRQRIKQCLDRNKS